ncbi:MAG: hypothetical protein ACKODP_09770 [Actinomycetota bacterium]
MADPVSGILDGLIHRADLDALVRHVDDTCSSRDWEHLVRIRDAARSAVGTGRQLWPITTLANHRLALWAPAHHAVRALDDTARTFMPGPVSEILAVHHTWDDLAPHLPRGHDRSLVAHERALRGDAVPGDEESVLDMPFVVQSWEPAYTAAAYGDDGVVDAAPVLPVSRRAAPAAGAPPVLLDDDETVTAFRSLMEVWTSQSNGTAWCSVVEGGIAEALALAGEGTLWEPVDGRDALSLLAWAGSSGGAHGRRRGLATGRSFAWWFLATFAGITGPRGFAPGELGEVVATLRCAVFGPPGAGGGDGEWSVRLVLEDPQEGVACIAVADDFS